MKKFAKIYPYIFCFFSILIAFVLWDFLKLPYDENNIVQGSSFNKKINPYDNIIKVLFFIFFPLLVFLLFFLKIKGSLSINPYNDNFFLLGKNINFHENYLIETTYKKIINYFALLFVFLSFLEFFSLNFKILLQPIDIYHDGLVLVPPINFYNFKKFWLAIHFDYGIGGNLRPILIWKLLGLESIGAARFLDQCIILFNKILLILICRKISFIIRNKEQISVIFFIFLSLSTIQLTDYFVSLTGTGGSEFPLRLFLFLIFYFLLIENIQYENIYFKSIILGTLSSISFLWFTDIAFYINGVLFIFLLTLVLIKDFKKIYFIIFGAFLSWISFLLIFGLSEVNQMFYQINSNLEFIYYFNFLEFPKPFSDDYASSRALKSLLLIILNGILCINLCLNKRLDISLKGKLLLIITFICSIVIFKSALVRADSYHLKYTLGFILFLFFIQTYYLLFICQNFLSNNISKINLKRNATKYIMVIFILGFFTFTEKINLSKMLKNFKNEISLVLNKDDDYFLNFKSGMYNYGRIYSENNQNDDKEFIEFYRNLTSKDDCVQNFTEYLGLAYFLKKPTCTSFYNPQFIQHGVTDKKFIIQFEKNLPNYILYGSPITFFDKSGYRQQNYLMNGIPNVETFIKKNYSFYTSYLNNWIIYKKNNF